MSKLQFQRTSFLENIEVELTFDHGGRMPAKSHVHDPVAKKERVRFDVVLSWRSPAPITAEDSIDDVVNYAKVYHFIRSLSDTVQTSPLESILDKICEIGLTDPRVDEIVVKLSRIDLAPPGIVGVAVRKQTLRNRF